MALINCPECNKENVSDSAESCPNCGYGIRKHFEKIKNEELARKKEEEQIRLLKEAEERRKKEEEIIRQQKIEQVQKIQGFWNKNKIRIFIILICILALTFGTIVFIKKYYNPNKALSNAQNYIEKGKYEDALNELVQADGFGNSNELYEAAMIGITEKNYKEAISYMKKGELENAEEILSNLNLNYVLDNESVVTSLELIKKYKDSSWNGEWENDGFFFYRITKVVIKNNKPYIQISQTNGSSLNEVEYPDGNSFYIDDNLTMEGNVMLLNDDQITFPYFSAPQGYYIWSRVGSDAENVYDSQYKKEPQIGMTHEQVEKSTWGSPDKINKTTYAWGTTEQWVYSNNRYIYFDDGKVTAISE